MQKSGNQGVKYHIEVGQAQGAVFGDYAHVEHHFHAVPPPPPPASRDELLAAIRQACAELRTYISDIAGVHIERAETEQIVEWVLNAAPKEQLGMLLDQPGSGKTVVLHDVLEQLEGAGIPTLAIKADSLSSVETRNDLAERLGLPAPVKECARHLAAEGPFVLILDQLDALSLALSRDQETLDVMLDTLARLRSLEGVRIVASCRTFDLNNDPRLSQIKVDRKFQLQPLDEEQINEVLQVIGVDPAHLLPAHRMLLTVPLHLDIYAQVVAASPPGLHPESYRSLQELYDALWRKRIEVVPPDAPAPPERVSAVYQLVEAMQTNRQLTAPAAVLDEHSEAATCLEGAGFIRREGSNWLFLHQTLFDYCYARRFVAQGYSLVQEILGSPQGLFERSQMIQVLAYLRGADERTYRRELAGLLFADRLRVHLRLLVIGWFGAFPNPTTDELYIARRLMKGTDDRAHFLQAAGGNGNWFDLLNDGVLSSLLSTDNAKDLDVVTNYLAMAIQHRTDPVLARLRPFVGKSEDWDARIAFCLSRIEDWQSAEAVNILCDLLRRGRTGGREGLCFHQMAKSNPAGGCRALRAYLDYGLDSLLAKAETERSDRFFWERQLLGEYSIGEVMDRAHQVDPEAVIEHLLPWFVRATMTLTEPRQDSVYYPSDPLFSRGWYGEQISEGPAFARRIAKALQHLARAQLADFRAIASQLAAAESLAIQRVLAQAYLADPATYAYDILDYLMADGRRLNVGEREDRRYDSWRLYGAAFQHVNSEQRTALEQLILDFRPAWELRGLQRQGFAQLQFLKSVPVDLLSETGWRRLQELERRYPGFELRPPRGPVGGLVGPPIGEYAQSKMSDEAWLGAMRKYDDSTEEGASSRTILKGGIIQLSRAFAKHVEKDPDRFYHLAQRFDDTISLHYVVGAISGLAESEAPAQWLFDLVHEFAPRVEGEFRRLVCWALEKRANDGVPDDLLDMMTDWALHDPDPTEELWQVPAWGGALYYGGDPYDHGINTNRGGAIEAVCRCAWKRKPRQAERAFCLLEQAADDPSTAVRSCVIASLGPLLNKDGNRALTVFERCLDGHPRLLQTRPAHDFLHWTYYHHFSRVRPFIETLLNNNDDDNCQAGARLACLAAFQHPEAEELVDQVMQGDVAMRRGAAQVYARNLEKLELEAACQERLLQLVHDPDEQVRGHVGECFQYLRFEHLERLRPFIEQFLISPAMVDGAEYLVRYLAPLAADTPALALMATERILDVVGGAVTDMRTATAVIERDLARFPLAVYTHTFDPVEKSRAMDLFERLLLLGSRTAHHVLRDWDRR